MQAPVSLRDREETMRKVLLAAVVPLVGIVSLAAAETPLTPAQYKSVMSSFMIARGDYGKLANPHKALAACIVWSKSKGDKLEVGPSATLGGDDLASIKQDVMKACVGFEKDYDCKCQLVDVDGKPAE